MGNTMSLSIIETTENIKYIDLLLENIPTYKTYPRIVGETGGKDFVMVHPTADVDTVVTALARGAFEYQGQ
jgi:acyl-CoA reductase-like NAD-dependent aldehyde dehydrogenase